MVFFPRLCTKQFCLIKPCPACQGFQFFQLQSLGMRERCSPQMFAVVVARRQSHRETFLRMKGYRGSLVVATRCVEGTIHLTKIRFLSILQRASIDARSHSNSLQSMT